MSLIKSLLQRNMIAFEKLLADASKTKNPALYLYTQQARNILFQIEGLSRLLVKIDQSGKSKKVLKSIKLLEDLLGQADYYDAFHKDFKSNTTLPRLIKEKNYTYFQVTIASIQDILLAKKWLPIPSTRIKKIQKTIDKQQAYSLEKELELIMHIYQKDIFKLKKILQKYQTKNIDVENDLHEVRRKLRWLSIYAQALQGAIVLVENISPNADLKKYLTKSVLTSPFNTLPVNKDLEATLQLDKNSFYALSWIIAELGNLKDQALKIQWLKNSYKNVLEFDKNTALTKTNSILKSVEDEKSILDKSKILLQQFKNDKVLETLLIGIHKN